MIEDFLVRVPIKTKPKLPKGRLHKLYITPEKFEISSWENLYGNEKSEKIFSVLHQHILEIQFKMPLVKANEGYCKIVYQDELGQQKNLKFCIMGPNAYHQNEITEKVADLLADIENSYLSMSSSSYRLDIPLEPPKNIRKLFYGLMLFSGLFISVGTSGGLGGLLFVGLFLLFPSLIAIGIDYVRLDTGWSGTGKTIAYIIIFSILFITMVTIIFFVDYYGLFR